ncbi:MAG: threonine--tRNA ligase [Chitinophagaceae bacterium]|jgi:threonyl-tRNA synthetase|nr:threonine--tRNA ligase [Bacteroidota bacterium]MBK9506254.1 threonine--tRNA ligase [Bacteroidota bacterium]MBK9555258.1 threonine--tRNA ligase [Bacteroidota bacterium]MBL0279580.1 threonine--tRNA ligase [Bacteroidota bacterium]MBP9878748.1 threonine--tRNA ligase [Chitinophagales bacterium]
MIKITFPDGNIREYQEGVTSMEVAKSISEGLARKILSAEVNGEVWDLSRPITSDATVKLLTWDDPKGKNTFWHSSAHLMAEALEALYPGVKLGIGPAIDHGFYYDIDLGGRVLTAEELPKIESKMKELAKTNSAYIRKEVSKADAIEYFTQKGDEYKLELISDLEDGSITFYSQGNFVDLCRGPHIPETGVIKAVKLLNIAGAYWRGDEKNKMLTRLYGITFPKQSELDEYMVMLEEAKKRDHRKLGKELEIYTTDDEVGQGLILWMPNGAAIIEQLEKLAKKKEEQAGYMRVKTPHIAKEDLYLTSGHLPYYADSMYPPMEMEGVKYYLKAMNCPHHHKIFSAAPRSYRDLPLRFAEYGMCYRYEESGALFGLMRVRGLNMNDAHIYCTEEQFENEFKAVNDMYLNYFRIFGIDKYVMRFSTHEPKKLGQKYLDNPELWKKTEDMVRRVMDNANIPYIEVPDEAAFYGPKIDIQIYSAIGREFTLATNQVDFGQPLRFGLTYTDRDNQPKMPLVIHRAPLGTHERFIGFLLEHYAGNFPVWLAPVQVAILPISDKYNEYCQEVINVLKNNEIRTYFDTRSEKIGRKIRDAEVKKIPLMLIVGEQEMNSKTLSLRKHGEGDKGSITAEELANMINEEIKTIFQ